MRVAKASGEIVVVVRAKDTEFRHAAYREPRWLRSTCRIFLWYEPVIQKESCVSLTPSHRIARFHLNDIFMQTTTAETRKRQLPILPH